MAKKHRAFKKPAGKKADELAAAEAAAAQAQGAQGGAPGDAAAAPSAPSAAPMTDQARMQSRYGG